MKKIFLVVLPVLFAFYVSAQTDTVLTAGQSVIVKQDARIGALLKKHAETNEVLMKSMRRSGPGFRILVINTPSRDKAIEAKTKMYQDFPELKSYLLFQSPKFHLKVGNFRERAEAEAYLESIKVNFSSGVYIVRDTIEYLPVSTDEASPGDTP